MKAVKAGKKVTLFCPIAFRGYFPEFAFLFTQGDLVFPVDFNLLGMAISVGENVARRYPAGVGK